MCERSGPAVHGIASRARREEGSAAPDRDHSTGGVGTLRDRLAYAVCMVSKRLIFGLLAIGMWAQAPKTAIFDSRLPVHTILREDIFSGYDGNMDRLARGERNLEALLVERTDAKANLMAWKGSIALTRAVYAHEAGWSAEFEQQYRKALDLYAEAARLQPKEIGVLAV